MYRYTTPVTFVANANNGVEAVQSNIKLESFPHMIFILLKPTDETRRAYGCSFPEGGVWGKPDLTKLNVTASTRSGLLLRMSQRNAYQNFKELCASSCDITEQEWKDYYPIVAFSPEQCYQKPGVYEPMTISARCTWYKPEFLVAASTRVAYEQVLMCFYKTSVSVSENSCSIAQLRISKDTFAQQLGGMS
jgi:hypothetical protein